MMFLLKKEVLDGPGVIVEIDEFKFGKRKYYKGHRVEGQWIFGGFERYIFIIAVENRFLQKIEKYKIIIA